MLFFPGLLFHMFMSLQVGRSCTARVEEGRLDGVACGWPASQQLACVADVVIGRGPRPSRATRTPTDIWLATPGPGHTPGAVYQCTVFISEAITAGKRAIREHRHTSRQRVLTAAATE